MHFICDFNSALVTSAGELNFSTFSSSQIEARRGKLSINYKAVILLWKFWTNDRIQRPCGIRQKQLSVPDLIRPFYQIHQCSIFLYQLEQGHHLPKRIHQLQDPRNHIIVRNIGNPEELNGSTLFEQPRLYRLFHQIRWEISNQWSLIFSSSWCGMIFPSS